MNVNTGSSVYPHCLHQTITPQLLGITLINTWRVDTRTISSHQVTKILACFFHVATPNPCHMISSPNSPIQPYHQAHLHQYRSSQESLIAQLSSYNSARLIDRLPATPREAQPSRFIPHRHGPPTGPKHLQLAPSPVLPILNSSPNCRSSPQDAYAVPRVFVAFGPILSNYCMLVPYHRK